LDYFQTGRAHLLLISNTPGQRGGALGIVSCELGVAPSETWPELTAIVEDLIEEIIGEEIVSFYLGSFQVMPRP
jgi:metal transporter CNNM